MKWIKKNRNILIFSLAVVILIISIIILQKNRYFDTSSFRTGQVLMKLDALTSDEYKGRLTGSEGNNKASQYVADFFEDMGIEPAGEDGSYFQNFKTIVPQVDSEPIFTISDENDSVLLDLTMYSDYRAITSFNCGGVDFTGDILFVGNNLYRIDPAIIKDRMVLSSYRTMTSEIIDYVMNNGGAGILNNADQEIYVYIGRPEIEKDVTIWTKTGGTIFAANISDEVYRKMLGMADEYVSDEKYKPEAILPNTRIKVDIGFPVVDTANVLGVIDGKANNGKILMISANMDGAGEGPDGMYFPGAISNTTGLAVLMETARIAASQDNLPYETLVFAVWNGQKQQFSGSEYYLEHPLFPPEKTTLIHLEDLGYVTKEGLLISSDSKNGYILKDKISNYAEDLNINFTKAGPFYGPASRFSDNGAAACVLSDVFYMQDNYYDNAQNVDSQKLEETALLILNFIKREAFADTAVDYLNGLDIMILSIITLIIFFNVIISRGYRKNPVGKILKSSFEEIYFSTPASLLRKFLQIMLPIAAAVFMLVLLVNIDPEVNTGLAGGGFSTNFSWYLTLKKSLLYFKGVGAEVQQSIWPTIFNAGLKSLLLIVSALLMSVIAGTATGMVQGYRTKRRNLRSLGPLVIFSIPDVLIVLLGVVLYVYMTKNIGFVSDLSILRKFIFPLITLSVLPSIYISRMTYISVLNELQMDYVRNARAKGLGRTKIFMSEVLPGVSFRTVDALPSIMTMLISNMIIVEYLFNYKGILHFLIYFYNRQDINGFVAMAVTLGMIYIIMTWGLQLAAGFMNPLKKGGSR